MFAKRFAAERAASTVGSPTRRAVPLQPPLEFVVSIAAHSPLYSTFRPPRTCLVSLSAPQRRARVPVVHSIADDSFPDTSAPSAPINPSVDSSQSLVDDGANIAAERLDSSRPDAEPPASSASPALPARPPAPRPRYLSRLLALFRLLRLEFDEETLAKRLGVDSVQWEWSHIGQVLGGWIVGFLSISWIALPSLFALTGLSRFHMSMRNQAIFHLLLDVAQCLMTLAILRGSLHPFRPRSLGFFPVKFHPRTWLPWVFLGVCTFPLIEAMSGLGAWTFPNESEVWVQGLEFTILSGDPITAGAYLLIVSICAPIWEEVMFRGFLLPSLAKYFKVYGSTVISALLFAMAHFSLSRSLPLIALGVIISLLFAASRNLVTAVALHSLWNMWVLATITARVAGA